MVWSSSGGPFPASKPIPAVWEGKNVLSYKAKDVGGIMAACEFSETSTARASGALSVSETEKNMQETLKIKGMIGASMPDWLRSPY